MKTDGTKTTPSIKTAEITDDKFRPYWSVMIPTFNCARYLRETLASVLSQDPGPDAMQIEVVDDCSTKDDPESVVRELGKGRVAFHRHAQNLGVTPNLNQCVARARGHWVHILHGDDFVHPGFYERLRDRIADRDDVAIAFCRSFIVSEEGDVQHVTPRLAELESGGRAFPPLHLGNPVQTPSVVVKRSFYESHGSFDPRFCHVADWEMWLRAAVLGGAVAERRTLASYRSFANNHTGRLARTAENVEDYVRLARHAEATNLATVDWRQFRRLVARRAAEQAEAFRKLGDKEAEKANWRFWRRWASWRDRVEYWGKRCLQRT